MQRVVVLGPSGAGKSELATRLVRATGLPVVHLDVLFWAPGWQPAPRDEARRALAAATAGDRWIVDGNFLDSAGTEHLARADTVLFLDLPRRTCLRRVLQRRIRYRRRRRRDLPAGCEEALDLEHLRYVWHYARDDRPRVLALLDSLGPSVAVHRLRSGRDVRRFLLLVLSQHKRLGAGSG